MPENKYKEGERVRRHDGGTINHRTYRYIYWKELLGRLCAEGSERAFTTRTGQGDPLMLQCIVGQEGVKITSHHTRVQPIN